MTSLTDALEDWQSLRDMGWVDPFIDPLAAAARRVAEAPEVWWCEEHDGYGGNTNRFDYGCTAWRPYGVSCRMVRKLLVDPAEET